MGTAPQAQALREGRLHIGFVAASIDDPALAVETVIRQSLVVALPRTHVLAERSHVPLQALATESLVMFERDLEPDFFDAIVNACREAGVGPNVAHEADSLHTACALVAAGLGLCLVPAGLQDARLGSIALRPLEPSLPHAELRIAIAYRREPLCDLVQLFVNVARDVATGQTVKI